MQQEQQMSASNAFHHEEGTPWVCHGLLSAGFRYLRHYSIIALTPFDRDNLSTIFTALVDWWLKKYR
jgi:hypothetical protein